MYDDEFNNSADSGRIVAAGVVAMVVGVAVGAAAALLIAPKTGQDLRESLLSYANNWRSVAADTISSGRERLINSVEKRNQG